MRSAFITDNNAPFNTTKVRTRLRDVYLMGVRDGQDHPNHETEFFETMAKNAWPDVRHLREARSDVSGMVFRYNPESKTFEFWSVDYDNWQLSGYAKTLYTRKAEFLTSRDLDELKFFHELRKNPYV